MSQKTCAIALGFFDGVHLGHAALLQRVVQVAERTGYTPAALTFDPHPEAVIFGARVPLLSSPADRADLMRRLYGIQEVLVARYDYTMMKMPWDVFLEDYLIARRKVGHIVVGHDFHFGYKGEGNPQRLRERCRQLGVGCDVIGQVVKEGITVSSTYIRTLVGQGEIERANLFLGHPHTATGSVAHGKKLGTTLGFPTVNLVLEPQVLCPGRGVYATRVRLEDGSTYAAVTNVGYRPTVDTEGERLTIEGFLLDFRGDLYGSSVQMEFHRFLREERRFPTLEALRTEVHRNAQQTRDYFAAEGR